MDVDDYNYDSGSGKRNIVNHDIKILKVMSDDNDCWWLNMMPRVLLIPKSTVPFSHTFYFQTF